MKALKLTCEAVVSFPIFILALMPEWILASALSAGTIPYPWHLF